MISDRTRTVIIGVVTIVWAANFLAGLLPSLNYKPDQAINGIFMVVVGGLFALGARGGGGDGGAGGGGEPAAVEPPAQPPADPGGAP